MKFFFSLKFNERNDKNTQTCQADGMIHTGPSASIDQEKKPDTKIDCTDKYWFQISFC